MKCVQIETIERECHTRHRKSVEKKEIMGRNRERVERTLSSILHIYIGLGNWLVHIDIESVGRKWMSSGRRRYGSLLAGIGSCTRRWRMSRVKRNGAGEVRMMTVSVSNIALDPGRCSKRHPL